MNKHLDLQLRLLGTIILLSGFLAACGDNPPRIPRESTVEAIPATAVATSVPGFSPTARPTMPPTSGVAVSPAIPPPGQPPTAKPASDRPPMVKVQIDTPFNLSFGQVAQLEPEVIQLSLSKVVEDSRCPPPVNCVWSGQLITMLNLSKNGKMLTSVEVNSLDARRNKDKPTFENYNIALNKATPSPFYANYGTSNAELKPVKLEDYVLELVITKVEKGFVPAEQAVLEHRVQLKYGQAANYSAEGLTFKFTALLEERRCPKSNTVACATAGQATIELTANKTGRNQPQALRLTIPGLVDDTSEQIIRGTSAGYITNFEGYKIQLISVQPQVVTSDKSKLSPPELYFITIIVTKET